VQAVAATYFYEGMPLRHQGGRDGVKKTPARHPSQCSDPEFRCSVGDVSSTIASSALPPHRAILEVGRATRNRSGVRQLLDGAESENVDQV